MSSGLISSFLGGGAGGGTRSIQRGSINLQNATIARITISPVDPARTELRWLGQRGTGGAPYSTDCTIVLASSTQIEAERLSSNGGNDYSVVSWELTSE